MIKLARKYDKNDILGECKISPTPSRIGPDSPDGPDKNSEKSSLRAIKTETGSDGQKRLDNPNSVPTVQTVRTTSQGEGGLDSRREAALHILRIKEGGYANLGEATRAVMAVYPDADEARMFVNYLVRDGLFGKDPDGRLRREPHPGLLARPCV